jgi:hypothetical protein
VVQEEQRTTRQEEVDRDELEWLFILDTGLRTAYTCDTYRYLCVCLLVSPHCQK